MSDKITGQLKSQLASIKCHRISCDYNWKSEQKKIIDENSNCVDNCINENKYEFNGKYFDSCESDI